MFVHFGYKCTWKCTWLCAFSCSDLSKMHIQMNNFKQICSFSGAFLVNLHIYVHLYVHFCKKLTEIWTLLMCIFDKSEHENAQKQVHFHVCFLKNEHECEHILWFFGVFSSKFTRKLTYKMFRFWCENVNLNMFLYILLLTFHSTSSGK